MSDTRYIIRDKPELRMPKEAGPTDDLGIRYHGPVLSGLIGVEEQMQRQAVTSPQTSASIRDAAPGGLDYLPLPPATGPGQYSRTEPDPVYAAQREDVGRRDLADPVIRHHLNLPPLPDPYEQNRRIREGYKEAREKREGR